MTALAPNDPAPRAQPGRTPPLPPANPPPTQTPEPEPPKRRKSSAEVVGERQSIFVFGSNTAGIHGKGAALFARQKRGAILKRPVGLQGTSYAIPTRLAIYNNTKFVTLPLSEIAKHVNVFLAFARAHQEMDFEITNLGCGLAGYHPQDVAPLFLGAPDNCNFTVEFRHYMRQAMEAEMSDG